MTSPMDRLVDLGELTREILRNGDKSYRQTAHGADMAREVLQRTVELDTQMEMLAERLDEDT